MNALEIMLKAMGVNPDMFAQVQQVFVAIAQDVVTMKDQLSRIESNTNYLIDVSGNVAPAAPSDYAHMAGPDGKFPSVLPPMIGEAKPPIILTGETRHNPNGVIQ